MNNVTNKLENPRHYFSQIARTNEFLEGRKNGLALPEAMASVALKLVDLQREKHSGHLDVHGNARNIIARLPDYIEGQHELDKVRLREDRTGSWAPREQKIPHLTKAIEFNHAIRETIDSNPALSTNDVLRFITRAHMGLSKDMGETRYIQEQVRGVLVGMQHEIAVEQALWSLEGTDNIQEASLADELKGIDIKLDYFGKPVDIDVKAGRMGETKAWEKWKPGKPLPFWSGLDADELGTRFRANDSQVEVVKARLTSLLSGQQTIAV